MRHSTIQTLYDIFSTYKLNDRVTGCDCGVCITEEYNNYLHSLPLEQLDADSFVGYVSSVDILGETLNDFKHFFPRIMEIIYDDIEKPEASYFYWQIWTTLKEANILSWETSERTAIIDFLNEYWKKVNLFYSKDIIEEIQGNLASIKFYAS